MMKGIMKTMALAVLCATSLSTFAATDNTPLEAYNDITRSLADLQPITFQAPAEKYKLLVFIDNQCVYCSNVVKNVKQYTDAGLTMSFLTVAPKPIRDSVIEDMGRVWCSTDKVKSLQKAMTGFLPDNETTPACSDRVTRQSALAERLGINITPFMVVIEPESRSIIGSQPPAAILAALKK
ncbi:thioredoxin fold domain-containing protein [Enterobacter sp. 170198]|uniref:Thioredoxin fold domain-containing protein n=2 Tax=Enterobacterales TaxID=91347 RepID=A0ABU5CYV7_9ENTR|nr:MULTISPECIES: thioredoxin fold domain-containing protein [Enterobacteriaceae]MDY0416396.1 thioredoxin fold domain-containing protein [Enterobacter sp. 170198]TFB20029.1 thioredoxin-like domain protein [Lelliottia nimipressuralis]